MSDIDTEMAKLHQETATHNSRLAIKTSKKTQEDLEKTVIKMDRALNSLAQKVLHLEQKYNLLLSKNFNTGPTET